MKHLRESEKNADWFDLVHVLLWVCDTEVTLKCEAMRIYFPAILFKDQAVIKINTEKNLHKRLMCGHPSFIAENCHYSDMYLFFSYNDQGHLEIRWLKYAGF